MSEIKISISLSSSQLLWDYKDSRGRDFWEEFAERISGAVAPEAVKHERMGSFRHLFYVASDRQAEQCRELVEQILQTMLPEEEKRRAVIISVTTPEGGHAVPEQPKAVEEPQELQELQEPQERLREETAPAERQPAPAKPRKAESLSERAEKINELKKGLLGKVRGQRHAVDEMVQSIFECEMFAANNPKRRGPLATFLFAGPSGVGKTFLAEQCGELLGRKMLVVDMSEYSGNLSNGKFNGEFGQPAVVTSFVKSNPNGIIVFDEVEKAHINTIYLFLQILDAGRLTDQRMKKEVSFRDTIIIMTTNAGKALYEDTSVCDLSSVPRSVILEALRTEINPQTSEPFFPSSITTRMANGHVILFNHLEPYALMEIVRDEIALQVDLFERASGLKVSYDPQKLASLVLYNGGGVADARSLRGLAKNILVRELQEIVLQVYAKRKDGVNALKNIVLEVDTAADPNGMFVNRDTLRTVVFADAPAACFSEENTVFDLYTDTDRFQRRIRGVTDYILLDPLCGLTETEQTPNDVEDVASLGMQMFEYVREFSPETPVYILDTAAESPRSFDTLLARGARGVVRLHADGDALSRALKALSEQAMINNATFALSRAGEYLSFNCAQYAVQDETAMIRFEKLRVKSAASANDKGQIAARGASTITFQDIIGCRHAKKTLSDYCKALEDPRKTSLSGKRMPKGTLLYGPPGTGKTMLAKAMANECGATFFPTSATSFFGSLVGETERNIRELFRKARRYAPSIIFIDEVDAIGRMRSGSAGSIHNEDALTTFLAEMDGFVTDEKRPVFILAATNYDIEGDGGRVLDPAFVRRFDSKILIPLPDTDERYDFLVMCLKKHGIHFGDDHEKILRNMAIRTSGMSNADLDMMHAQYVRTLGDAEPDSTGYMNALDAFRFGEVNKMDAEHLRQTACHEAGHALVCRLCGTTPSFLTIVSRGDFGGFMESAGEKRGIQTYDDLMGLVCRCLAGRAAEVELYGQSAGINTGASSDIRKARYYIRTCLNEYAMGEEISMRGREEDAEKLIRAQYTRTQELLHTHRQTLERLTDLLAEKKSLDQTQMETFFEAEHI